MERQSSTPVREKTPASPPSGSHGVSPTSSTHAAVPARRRKNQKSSNYLFGFLRTIAIVGPFGFAANIIYFQFYFNKTWLHTNHPPLHPLYAISKGATDRYNHHRLMSGNDNDNNNNNNNADEEDIPSFLSGTAVLRRLQKRAAFSWKECGSSSQTALDLEKQLLAPKEQHSLRKANNKHGLLEPFALRDALDLSSRKLQEKISGTQKGAATTPAAATTAGTDRCMIPQPGSRECDVSTYSIVVTFQGETNFRPLFMNLLSFLTFPFVSDIVVIMPHNDWGYEGQTTVDVKYKNRLKAWHADKNHKVSMIGLPATLSDEPRSRFGFDTIVNKVWTKVNSKAVLFMDGSILWNGNVRGLQAGFELWKQNPHAIVATHKLQPANANECPSEEQLSARHNRHSSLASFCQSPEIPNDIGTLYQQYQNILDMNGVFVHRDMLCLMQKPPLSNILIQSVWRVLDDVSNPQVTHATVRSILATTLLQISGHPPLLFPPRISRPRNETKDYNDNWHYLPSPKETEWLHSLADNTTTTQQKVLVPLLGYFGTGLATRAVADSVPYYWCASRKKVDDIFFMEDMPWVDGGEYSTC